mmetsp:Transcript_14184/g.41257  ORF Transcript_14184/g.41257 Transcript_14184/m.41257 type:complete len:373 (+) Transcript_14184:2318-3436(+)
MVCAQRRGEPVCAGAQLRAAKQAADGRDHGCYRELHLKRWRRTCALRRWKGPRGHRPCMLHVQTRTGSGATAPCHHCRRGCGCNGAGGGMERNAAAIARQCASDVGVRGSRDASSDAPGQHRDEPAAALCLGVPQAALEAPQRAGYGGGLHGAAAGRRPAAGRWPSRAAALPDGASAALPAVTMGRAGGVQSGWLRAAACHSARGLPASCGHSIEHAAAYANSSSQHCNRERRRVWEPTEQVPAHAAPSLQPRGCAGRRHAVRCGHVQRATEQRRGSYREAGRRQLHGLPRKSLWEDAAAGGDAPKLRHGQGGSRMLVSPGAPASRAVRGKHGRRALHRVLRAHVAALHHCSIQLPGGKRNIMDASRPRLLT